MKGDTVQILLDNPVLVEQKIVGVVENVFDALTQDGEEGINLEIDIRYGKGHNKWFRYKPVIDGGTMKVLKRKQ